MVARFFVVAFTFLAIPLAQPTQAALLIVDTNGHLIGASDVLVGSTSYDVEFWDGTCGVLFRTCDFSAVDVGLPDFAFTTTEDANAAAQALLDQVFLDTPLGNFDTGFQNTRGCENSIGCMAMVPYYFELNSGPLDAKFAAATAINFTGGLSNPPADRLGFGIFGSVNFNSTGAVSVGEGNTDALWARFIVAGTAPPPPPATAVPEPSALLLLGFGLAALARRRRLK